MIYQILNHVDGCYEYVEGTELEAATRAAELKALYMEREAYRFTVSYEAVDGNNTTWRAADANTDPADGVFNVFNHKSGQYEKIVGRDEAFARLDEIKNEFIQEFQIGHYEQVESKPVQPISRGTQDL